MEVLVRRAQYLRLAAAHAGPLGPALLGHPGLAPLYEKTCATCSGAPGLPCEGVGESPGSAWCGGWSAWPKAP
jgi:hypothetical protein